MALSKDNNFLQDLVTASTDAMTNLYTVRFNLAGSNKESSKARELTLRCDGFTPPSVSQPKYTVNYITAHIDRPSTKVTVDRKFSLKFRVDANYECFKLLLAQQDITFNPVQNYVTNDIKHFKEQGQLFSATVNYLRGGVASEGMVSPVTNTEVPIFKFDDCWITSIEPIKYSYASGDAATVSLTVSFIEMYDLKTGIV